MMKRKNQELKIEHGIPIPVNAGGRSKGFSAILRRLEAGDSVVLPVSHNLANSRAAYALGRGNYAARKVGNGTRIWRLK